MVYLEIKDKAVLENTQKNGNNADLHLLSFSCFSSTTSTSSSSSHFQSIFLLFSQKEKICSTQKKNENQFLNSFCCLKKKEKSIRIYFEVSFKLDNEIENGNSSRSQFFFSFCYFFLHSKD